jgi:hypothetical protein
VLEKRMLTKIFVPNREKCMSTFVGKPDGKKPIGRPRSRWEENIKTYLLTYGAEPFLRSH